MQTALSSYHTDSCGLAICYAPFYTSGQAAAADKISPASSGAPGPCCLAAWRSQSAGPGSQGAPPKMSRAAEPDVGLSTLCMLHIVLYRGGTHSGKDCLAACWCKEHTYAIQTQITAHALTWARQQSLAYASLGLSRAFMHYSLMCCSYMNPITQSAL